MQRLLWNGWLRAIAFWLIVVGVLVGCDYAIPVKEFDLSQIGPTIGRAVSIGVEEMLASPALDGNQAPEEQPAVTQDGAANSITSGHKPKNPALEEISDPKFAISLAVGLGCLGLGLLVAFLIMHWAAGLWTLWRFRGAIARPKDRKVFAEVYDNAIYPRLIRHPLLGHAWKEFDETLLKGPRMIDGVIGNTVRPQSFVNFGVIRERLSGLKMLGSISGYFVGAGLLLTFIGIVLALYEASEAANASDVKVMQDAMGTLLQIASFKFSTSIAGLAVSIVFAIAARMITISLERRMAWVCDAAEHQMRYVAPQSLAVEMNVQSKEQLDQLKEINSDRYFSKLADSVSPLLEAAMARAMEPITQQISVAVGNLKESSQSGVSEMIGKFSESLQGSAGTELRELGASLKEMHEGLASTQAALQGTGEAFSQRLSDAADNLNRLVGDAAAQMGAGAASNQAALQEVVSALKATFAQANERVDKELGGAAEGAAMKIGAAMDGVFARLDGQVGGLVEAMRSFQHESAAGLNLTRQQILDAQHDAAGVIATVGSEAAHALRSGLQDALERINEEFERFGTAMRSGVTAYDNQARAIGDATAETQKAGEAFSRVADNVRSASTPLLQGSERIAQATAEMANNTRSALAEIETLASGARVMAESLKAQAEKNGEEWRQHSERFEGADRSLATAVGELGKAFEDTSTSLNDKVAKLDLELSKVLDRLRPLVGEIGESAGELSESVSMLVQMQRAAE